MVDINLVLSVLLYIAGIILLIVLTILGIKLISLVEKADRILNNVEGKVTALDGVFNTLTKVTSAVGGITDSFVLNVTSAFARIFGNKKKQKESEEIIYE